MINLFFCLKLKEKFDQTPFFEQNSVSKILKEWGYMSTDDLQVLSVGKIAGLCHVGRATVQRWVNQGKIKSFKLPSGHKRIHLKDFLEFLREYDMPCPKELCEVTKKVLIVDDDESVVKSLKEMLLEIEGFNFEIQSASCGIQACLKLGAFNPDLMLLDYQMPDISGMDVVKELFQSPESPNTKVVVVSGFLKEGDEAGLIDVGVKKVLHKPLLFDAFESQMRECLLET